jgi:hypothetical protein
MRQPCHSYQDLRSSLSANNFDPKKVQPKCKWRKAAHLPFVQKKVAHEIFLKLTSGVNFTNPMAQIANSLV